MKINTFLKKTSIYFIGNISTRLLSLVLIPIYAFFTTKSDLGEFDYLITLSSVLYPILFIAIWESILRFILKADSIEERNSIITNALIYSLLASIVSLVLMGLIGTYIKDAWFIYALTVSYGMSTIWLYLARATSNNRLYVFASLFGSVINILMVVLFVTVLNYGFLGLYVSFITGQVATFIIIESKLKLVKKSKLSSFNRKLFKKMAWFSLPLTLNHVALWAMNSFGRVYITNMFGTEYNGLISFATKITIPVSMMGTVIIMSLVEEAIISNDNNRLTLLTDKITKFFILMSLGILPTSKVAFLIIQNTDYYSSLSFIPYLLLFATFSVFSSMIGTFFQANSITKYQFITTIFGSISNVIAIILFTPYYGIYGVLLAQIIGIVIVLVSRIIYLNKLLNIKYMYKDFIVYSILYICASIVFNLDLIIAQVLLIFVILMTTFLVFKKDIKNIIMFAASK
jgi:O-antigen/teichoic acid export membrane protein